VSERTPWELMGTMKRGSGTWWRDKTTTRPSTKAKCRRLCGGAGFPEQEIDQGWVSIESSSPAPPPGNRYCHHTDWNWFAVTNKGCLMRKYYVIRAPDAAKLSGRTSGSTALWRENEHQAVMSLLCQQKNKQTNKKNPPLICFATLPSLSGTILWN